MTGNSICLRVKRGKPGNYPTNWLYESEGETELQIPRKMSGRELLTVPLEDRTLTVLRYMP